MERRRVIQNSPEQARELARLYPGDALGPISRGISHAFKHYIAQELVNALAPIKTADVTALLKGYTAPQWPLSVRTAAADELLSRGDDSSLDQMINAWKTYRPNDSTVVFDLFDGGRELIEFLMQCKRVEAIDALRDGLDKRPPGVRMWIVGLLLYNGSESDPGRPVQAPRKDESSRAALVIAAESLLAGELSDTEVSSGAGYTRSVTSDRPRICDVAASGLAQILPLKYKFKMSSSERDMDTQRMISYKIWKSGSQSIGGSQPNLHAPEKH